MRFFFLWFLERFVFIILLGKMRNCLISGAMKDTSPAIHKNNMRKILKNLRCWLMYRTNDSFCRSLILCVNVRYKFHAEIRTKTVVICFQRNRRILIIIIIVCSWQIFERLNHFSRIKAIQTYSSNEIIGSNLWKSIELIWPKNWMLTCCWFVTENDWWIC